MWLMVSRVGRRGELMWVVEFGEDVVDVVVWYYVGGGVEWYV